MERAILLGGGAEIDAGDVATRGPVPPPTQDAALPFPATLGEVIKAAVHQTLELCRGNKSDAARRLAISRSRLQRLLDTGSDAGDDYDDSRGDQ
jgi:DNA-binding NtrC family response regulator